MHKKSIEAAEKLKEEDGETDIDITRDGPLTPGSGLTSPGAGSGSGGGTGSITAAAQEVNKEELRSESIAQLRAKAQSYQAKIREAVSGGAGGGGVGVGAEHMNSTPPDMFGAQRGSGFEPPARQTDTCDSDSLDPTN